MPRANHPIDGVTKYFREAPLEAAEQALHIARGILRERQPKKRAPRTPTAPKASAAAPKPSAKAPRPPTARRPASVPDGELVQA